MTDHCIDIQNLTKHFGDKTALNNICLQIDEGKNHAVVGSNGAGKSTLFKILIGIETPCDGRATLWGEDTKRLSPDIRRKVGFVNQEHVLPEWMTAKQATAFEKADYPNWDQGMYERVLSVFDVSPKQKVSSLSRGERAGLKLAIVMAQKPELLIFDEPTLGLDVVSKSAFLETLLFSQEDSATTTIYCSHQLEEIERVADSLIVLEKGELKIHSSPDELVGRVRRWITDFEDGAPALDHIPGCLKMREVDDKTHLWVIDQGNDFSQFLASKNAGESMCCEVGLGESITAFLSKNHAGSEQVWI